MLPGKFLVKWLLFGIIAYGPYHEEKPDKLPTISCYSCYFFDFTKKRGLQLLLVRTIINMVNQPVSCY